MERSAIVAGVLAAALVGGGAVALEKGDGYAVRAVLPNAGNLFVGSSVMYDGYEAGSVTDIEVQDGRALVSLSLDDEFGPLHDGASVEVVWKAALGERLVRVVDGDEKNAELPDGALLAGVQREPVELDAVLSALDEPTRTHLASLVTRLEGTLRGREGDARDSLTAAGPAVEQLGAVLRGVGTDGEAIRQIMQQLDETMGILGSRGESLERVVTSLASATNAVAQQQRGLGETLDRLPPVLSSATRTLDRVPGTVEETLPLLADLAPATKSLKPVAKNLRPLLQDLRPTVADLQPTLVALSELLGITPALLDVSTATLPSADTALIGLTPAIDFLRPYTPEIVGWATNWGSAGGNKDSNGHYVRFHIQTGTEAVIPSSRPGPGVTQNLTPEPGEPVGQPWTDADGSEMR
ncbi:MlaD family protein [Nocardioides sp. LHD-245]|uniref:MlaD family protein n=1 Tax=Nocardioides sp. LHD-245 TaxID=3051387 RepID=UPI0027DFE713|nr:MlaD family protein [Nocardioides sp. LHD-245]